MNEEFINFMIKSEKAKFQIEEVSKSTFSFIKSVQLVLEENKE